AEGGVAAAILLDRFLIEVVGHASGLAGALGAVGEIGLLGADADDLGIDARFVQHVGALLDGDAGAGHAALALASMAAEGIHAVGKVLGVIVGVDVNAHSHAV